MQTAALVPGVVLVVSVAVAGCFVGCGEEFSASDAAAGEASSAGEASVEGGAPGSSGGSGGTANSIAGQGGAPDSSAGGHDTSSGTPGAGGETTTATDAYRNAVLADHPLVYWRMGKVENGAVADETGSSNALVLQGTGHALGVAGAVRGSDSAIGFDGAASFAIATDSRALDFAAAAPFTLECWARRETGGASYFQHLVSNVEGVANNRDGYVLYLLPEPAAGETARAVFERDRPAKDLSIAGGIAKPSVWAQYVAVYDGLAITLYVDGTVANTAPALGNLSARKTPFAVGRAGSGANFFKGALDEIAVYATALNAAVIAKHFASSK